MRTHNVTHMWDPTVFYTLLLLASYLLGFKLCHWELITSPLCGSLPYFILCFCLHPRTKSEHLKNSGPDYDFIYPTGSLLNLMGLLLRTSVKWDQIGLLCLERLANIIDHNKCPYKEAKQGKAEGEQINTCPTAKGRTNPDEKHCWVFDLRVFAINSKRLTLLCFTHN